MILITSSGIYQYHHTNTSNMGCEILHYQWVCYKEDLDDISHCGYFMEYANNTVVILYWNPDQPFAIHRDYCDRLYEYNSHIFVEYKNTPGSLLLQKYPEILLHRLYLLNLIPFELNHTFTQFFDTKIIAYEIDLPTSGNKIRLNLLDDEYFTIPYVIDTIPNSLAVHQLPT